MNDQKPLGREDILAFRQKLKTRTIETQSLGTIRIQELTHGQLRKLAKGSQDDAEYFAASVVDENGNHLFSDSDIDDIAALPYGAVREVVRAIIELNNVAAKDETKN